MKSSTLVSIDSLSISVHIPEGQKQLVRDVSLAIDSGESVGLVGESGSGKSLTARTLIGLTPRHAVIEGTVGFDGRSVLGMSRADLQRYRSRDVSMIFQDPRAYINPLRSVGAFLTEGLVSTRGTSRHEADRIAQRLLGDVGVPEPERRMRQRPHELSGGLLQRVMIAAGLATEPRLMLADEPTTALDVTTQEEVMAILAEAIQTRGMAMLYITHDLDLAAAVCDRLVVMKDGEIVEVVSAARVHEEATHPYTRKLLAARIEFDSPQFRKDDDRAE